MPSLSPKTQQIQTAAGAGPDQETALFEQGFSDMAYGVLMNRMPDLVQDVVTFKVIDCDVDKGTGVGAFVVLRSEQPFYVPVVMADNAIKPLEVLYHKALNIFLPLSKGWLQEIDKSSLSSLGKGIKTPETLYTDVDIRNIVVPPITGRFSYASWHGKALVDASRVLSTESLSKEAADRPLALLGLLAAAPARVKRAFAEVLRRAPALAKHAAGVYGVNALLEALRPPPEEKIAAKQLYGGGLWIAGPDDSPTDFKRTFGDRAAEAYAGVRKKGFAARDERLNRNMAVQEQPYERWTEPTQPGVYVLTASTGEERPALVIPNPTPILSKGTRYGGRPAIPGRNPLVNNSYRDPSEYPATRVYPHGRPDESSYATKRPYGMPRFLAVFPNGDYLEAERLAGRDSVVDAVAGGPLHKRLFENVSGEPRAGLGVFVRQKGTTFEATVPIEIKSISEAGGERRIKAESRAGFDERVLITDPAHPYDSIWMPEGSNVAYLPADFVWIPLKECKKPTEFFTSVLDLAACASSALAASGARKVSIKDAGAGQFSVDGGPALARIAALRKIAAEQVLSADDADALLTKAAAERRVSAWIVSGPQLARAQRALDKLAADDDKGGSKDKKPKKAPPKDGGPSGGGGAEPAPEDDLGAQAAMASMQPPAPPPPSPAELAAMEMKQHIDTEIQKLLEHQQLLDAVAMRANQIAGGAAPLPSAQAQAMGAPPMGGGAPHPLDAGGDPFGGGGGAMPGMGGDPFGGGAPPPMGQPQGGDPFSGGSAMPGMGGDPFGSGGGGGAPPPMGPPGMDPSMGGGLGAPPPMGQPGMDPSMGAPGMAPPGMDPSMMAAAPGGALPQPPNAMMPPDGPNAQALGAEINPQFLGQAAQLQSADMFDAAAVASLAQSPALREIVGQYLPNLEKAVDNLSRVLLTLWMQEADLKGQIGEATYDGLEESLLNTFRGMGDLVLRLSQGAQAVKGQFDRAPT